MSTEPLLDKEKQTSEETKVVTQSPVNTVKVEAEYHAKKKTITYNGELYVLNGYKIGFWVLLVIFVIIPVVVVGIGLICLSRLLFGIKTSLPEQSPPGQPV